MAWLRLDDLFLDNPKIIGLTDRQLRIHLAAMLYSCRHYTLGTVPAGALRSLGATSPTVDKLVNAGLWERTAEGIEIHDFSFYNSLKTEDKVARFLLDHPTASANEIASQVGGNRKLVLATIRKLRFPRGTDPEPSAGSAEPPGTGFARRRARAVPSPKEPEPFTSPQPEASYAPNGDEARWGIEDLHIDSILKEIP